MRVYKISTIIISLLFFVSLSIAADKIYCKKYSGVYKNYNIVIQFSKYGKMIVDVQEKESGGYFSMPGSYAIKDTKIDFFYKGLLRTVIIEKESITATPYTFSIEEDLKTIIILKEDKSFPDLCD